MLRHPDTLGVEDQLLLKQVRARCPHLDAVAEHVTGFAEMMVGRHGERLDTRISQVEADDQPDLHRFANGVRRDYDAVRNGLTLPHSSGAVEETVNRIKMIKRRCANCSSWSPPRCRNSHRCRERGWPPPAT